MRTHDEIKDLIKRLRNNKVTLGHGEYGVDPLCELAAKELDEAVNEIERLRAALEPFAALADRYDPVEDDDEHTIWHQTALPTLGQLRRARAALEGK